MKKRQGLGQCVRKLSVRVEKHATLERDKISIAKASSGKLLAKVDHNTITAGLN